MIISCSSGTGFLFSGAGGQVDYDTDIAYKPPLQAILRADSAS
jgi:hypothetical protein